MASFFLHQKFFATRHDLHLLAYPNLQRDDLVALLEYIYEGIERDQLKEESCRNVARLLEISLPDISTAETGSEATEAQSTSESSVQVPEDRTQLRKLKITKKTTEIVTGKGRTTQRSFSLNEVAWTPPTCREIRIEPLENATRRKKSKVIVQIECNFCLNGFDCTAALEKHKKICQNNPNRVIFKCSRCGLEFAKKVNLNTHSEDCQ